MRDPLGLDQLSIAVHARSLLYVGILGRVVELPNYWCDPYFKMVVPKKALFISVRDLLRDPYSIYAGHGEYK